MAGRGGFRGAVAALLALTALSATADAGELEQFAYGRWVGAASTDDSGSFSRCAVTGRFKRASVTSGRDVAAAITMDRVNGWTIGFAGGGDNPETETYRVAVDGEAILEERPDAAQDQVAVIAVPDSRKFLGALRRGNTLTISSSDDQFDLTLAGVGRALDWIEDCAKRYAAFVAPGREKAIRDAAVLREDISGLMARLLEQIGARDARVGPPPGIPAFPSEDKSVSWRAEGLQGEIQVWAGKSARALTERIIGSSPGCKKRPAGAEGRRDAIVFEVVECVDPVGTRRIALVVMPRAKGGIYLISVQTKNQASPDAVDRLGERLAAAARRTVVR